ERSRLSARLADAYRRFVRPAYASFGKFLETAYAGKARKDPGVWSIPGGAEAYAFAARSQTTTTLSPDRIHQIGKEELEKNEREMLEIARGEGLGGELSDVMAAVGKDPRFRLSTREEVLSRYRAICARMDGRLAAAFGRLPKTPSEVTH